MTAALEVVGHLALIAAVGGTVHIVFKALWAVLPEAEKEMEWK